MFQLYLTFLIVQVVSSLPGIESHHEVVRCHGTQVTKKWCADCASEHVPKNQCPL